MSVGYELVNLTKREVITFRKLPVSSIREIAGNPASAALVAWYLYKNQGCQIQFVSDTYSEWPFEQGSIDDLVSYVDVTETAVEELIAAKILEDRGLLYRDSDDPELYLRDLRNVWMD